MAQGEDQIRAWDRIGRAMGDAGELGQAIAARNLDAWTTIASNLRKGSYTTDDAVKDAGRWTTAFFDNMRDAWAVFAPPPAQAPGSVALGPPIVFRRRPNRWELDSPPEIAVAANATASPHVRVIGSPSDTAKELEKFLVPRHQEGCIQFTTRGDAPKNGGTFLALITSESEDRVIVLAALPVIFV